jgi:glutamate racemase
VKIGVFDSGIGGLTVYRALRRRLPGAGIVYLGDTARVPYGTKSAETVGRYAREAAAFLLGQGVEALVVACNTVSAVALDQVAETVPVPVVGVLEPGVRRALESTRNARIGVIGQPATIKSDAYGRSLRALRPEATVLGAACPLFVPLAEEGWTGNEVARAAAALYLAGLKAAGVDTLVLGCTHYPLLSETIAAEMGPEVVLVDSAEAVAVEVARTLDPADAAGTALVGEKAGSDDRFYVTDSWERFREVAARFLGRRLEGLEKIDLEPAPA